MEEILHFSSIFVILSIIHFISDWIFQSEHMAKNKFKDKNIRAIHCIAYTVFFFPFFIFMNYSFWTVLLSSMVLFGSHYIIDSYKPVFLWAKYIRQIPELRNSKSMKEQIDVFRNLWKNPVYSILFITVDQILHILFLCVVSIIVLL